MVKLIITDYKQGKITDEEIKKGTIPFNKNNTFLTGKSHMGVSAAIEKLKTFNKK